MFSSTAFTDSKSLFIELIEEIVSLILVPGVILSSLLKKSPKVVDRDDKLFTLL